MDFKKEKFLERGSICSSIGGDTFASRGRLAKKSCALRQHSIASITKRFERQPFDRLQRQSSFCSSIGSFGDQNAQESSIYNNQHQQQQQQQISAENVTIKKRLNDSFHYFRFIIVMMGGFGLGLMLLLRYNITVAILNMVNQTAIYLHEHPNNTIEDFQNEGYTISGGEFDWDNEIQHMIMSWYMIAYTLPQIPCTTFGLKLGIRWAFPVSLSLCALCAILTPAMSYWGWEWVIGLRLIMGVAGAAVMPMLLCVVESWMPYDQLTLGLTCAQLLQTTVSATNPLFAGYLCAIHWKYAFYVPALVTFVFCILWVIIVTDQPDENWFISQREIDMICACEEEPKQIKNGNNITTNNINNNNSLDIIDKKETQIQVMENTGEEPCWKDIFRIHPIYSYMILWCFYCSPLSVFIFILPTYLRQFLKISVAENGLYCFIIQSGSLLAVMWPHPVLRFFNEKLNFSLTTSRRLAYFVVCSVVGLTWAYVGTYHSSQIIVLWISRCFQNSNDIIVTGNLMSNFARAGLSSVAFSVMNTVGNLSVVFASTFCGYVLDVTGQSEQGWTYIFYGLAGSQIVTFTIFCLFIKAGPVDFHIEKKRKKESLPVDDGWSKTNNERICYNNSKPKDLSNNIKKV